MFSPIPKKTVRKSFLFKLFLHFYLMKIKTFVAADRRETFVVKKETFRLFTSRLPPNEYREFFVKIFNFSLEGELIQFGSKICQYGYCEFINRK